MKRDLRCPKCAHDVLLHIKRAFPRETEGGPSLSWIRRTVGSGHHDVATTGDVEAYACERCGFLEFYLSAPIEVDGENVRRIGPTPAATYR